jgi:hypothetical protein
MSIKLMAKNYLDKLMGVYKEIKWLRVTLNNICGTLVTYQKENKRENYFMYGLAFSKW